MLELHIAEIPYDDGTVHFRYARYMSTDGTQWVRHGLFRCYYPNGVLASEGTYVNGEEHGVWTDYHPNGHMAAQGHYETGRQTGSWEFWTEDGSPEAR